MIDTDDYRYLMCDSDRHDNVRAYVRTKVDGKYRRIRIRDWSSFEAFKEEYRKAVSNPQPSSNLGKSMHVAPGSLRTLVQQYYGSAEFRLLGERTRRVRMGILNGMCETHGSKPYARMEPRHVRGLRDEKAEFPEAANARIKALRQVFAWAIEAGHAKDNPARDVPYIQTGSTGWHTWTAEEVHHFEERHPVGSKPRLALAVLLYTGVRRSDAVRLGRQMEQSGWLRFTEEKGKARHAKLREIPILPELRAVIDATRSGHLTYLVTEFGKPFTPAGFSNWFRRRCDEAGLKHCSAHGLRKAGATIAAENGATEHQLMAIFGWESPKEAAHYTRAANRKRLTEDAMHLLVPERNKDEIVPHSDVVRSGGTIRGKKS